MEADTPKNSPGSLGDRLGEQLATDFVAVPNALVRHVADLGLRPAEAMVLICLLSHRWNSTHRPRITAKRISRYLGVSIHSARAYLRRIEQLGFVRVSHRKGSANRFDLQPLLQVLEKLQRDRGFDDGVFEDDALDDVESIDDRARNPARRGQGPAEGTASPPIE